MASASAASEGKPPTQRRRSCDTVCSSNSCCLLHKRKPHPLASSLRTYVPRNSNNNTVKQRVMSARLLKLRSLQNQLNDANYHLTELQQENRALRNLQSRQDKALSRYEGTSADLPKLIKSHEEEIRILTAKNKTLRKNLKDVTDQLKIKEDELMNVREQLKKLLAMTKNKNLGERQALNDQVEDLKRKLQSNDDQINLLNRKLILEAKNNKFKLSSETGKNKQTQKELSDALNEIDRLTCLLESKGRSVLPPSGRKRFNTVNQRSSVSLINLVSDKNSNKQDNLITELTEQQITLTSGNSRNTSTYNNIDYLDTKLEPLIRDVKDSPVNDVMTSPSENVKARLSASSSAKSNDIDELSKYIEKVKLLESSFSNTSLNETTSTALEVSRPPSTKKLEKLASASSSEKILTLNQKEDDINQQLGKYCNEMLENVKDCNAVVDKHQHDFQFVKSETEKLLQSLRETDALNSKLRYSKFLDEETITIPEKDIGIANKILKDEYAFREVKLTKSSIRTSDIIKSDRNGNVIKKEIDVTQEDKNKLLATLRAIDNGEETEEVQFDSNTKSKLFGELFGNK